MMVDKKQQGDDLDLEQALKAFNETAIVKMRFGFMLIDLFSKAVRELEEAGEHERADRILTECKQRLKELPEIEGVYIRPRPCS